ncbi:MAG: hypothetical protein C0483_14105 [Pirellula sp.]|nr:hypothetical protein [Pirellula sp.]
MKTTKSITARRSTKSAANSAKSVTTRKPSAVKVRSVKGALAPPASLTLSTDNCPADIDAEARKAFPDLPFVIRTADGKEITGTVVDLRQEMYRIRRMKGDTLTTPEEISLAKWRKEHPATLADLASANAIGRFDGFQIIRIDGKTGERSVAVDPVVGRDPTGSLGVLRSINREDRFEVLTFKVPDLSKAPTNEAVPIDRHEQRRAELAAAASAEPFATIVKQAAAWMDAACKDYTGGDLPAKWIRKGAFTLLRELFIVLDEAMVEAGETKGYVSPELAPDLYGSNEAATTTKGAE